MTQPQRDDLLESIHELERSKRLWRRLALALGAGLLLLLLLAGGLVVALFLQANVERHRALEAVRAAEQTQREAMQQRERAEQQLRAAQEEQLRAAKKAANPQRQNP